MEMMPLITAKVDLYTRSSLDYYRLLLCLSTSHNHIVAFTLVSQSFAYWLFRKWPLDQLLKIPFSEHQGLDKMASFSGERQQADEFVRAAEDNDLDKVRRMLSERTGIVNARNSEVSKVN